MGVDGICDQIRTARRNAEEEHIFNRWIMGGYEKMGMSYADFRAALNGDAGAREKPQDKRTAQEISDELEKKLEGLSYG